MLQTRQTLSVAVVGYKLKTAVVGLGVIGKVHLKVLEKLEKNVVAVCDTDLKKLEQFSNIKGYTDYEQMLDVEKPNVVHLCTPHYLHAQMIITALNRDINVLCEKPLCITREEIALVLEAEKRSKGKLGVCHQNRFNPENRYLKEYLKNKTVLGAHGNVVWRRDANYYNKADWRGTLKGEGGGTLINQALHTLDLMQWFFGMPKSVVANCVNQTLKDTIEVEDTAFLNCSGGAFDFSFFATNGGAISFPVGVMVKTKEETISVQPNKVLVGDRLINFDNGCEFFGKSCYGRGHEGLIANFYDCIKDGSDFEINGEEGAKVIKIILSAYESNGQKVEV